MLRTAAPSPRSDSARRDRSGTLRRRWGAVAAGMVLATVAGVVALDQAFPPDMSRLADVSVTVADRDGRPLRLFLNQAQAWRLPADVADAPAEYLDLLLAFEDKRFRRHLGVDPLAVARAAGQLLSRGRIVSGASTLTMQVARLLEPRRRGLRAKLIEVFRAFQLEARHSKDEILAMYLTLAPFGGNLEGVRAAGLGYFGKSAANLTLPEAALLVALPRSPTRLRPDRAPEAARAARDAVLDRAVAAGRIDRFRAAEAKEEPVPVQRLAMPALAPHAAEQVARGPGGPLRRTTIDGDLQAAVENLARRALTGLDERSGLAVLVVDLATRSVLAYVGAPDARDARRFGPIDMVTATRSPGSALKPFIYAMGMDDGIIQAETLIADVSTLFGDYAPQNFDRSFAGELTVREALQRSLNVPAVLVLDRVGPLRFVEALRRTGVRLVLPPGSAPGLPVALGGGGISLWDMTMLYAGLGREGQVGSLRLSERERAGAETRFVSPEAARSVLRILEGAPPPPGLVRAPEVRRGAPIAVKTGTSYGFRDAWAFGVSPSHAVGVWTGRADGTPSPDRYGRTTAAPLVYAVLDLLPAESPRGIAGDGTASAPLLRRLAAGGPGSEPASDRPRLVFPADAAVIDAPEEGIPLTLEAAGGRRPLSWLIDGRRLAIETVGRTFDWLPDSPGAHRVTILDAEGRSDSVTVTIR